jgi:hypothetical protein
MSGWADYIDARAQLVHQWRSEGASIEDIVSRLEVDAERVENWLRSEPLPFPGSSRAQLAEWKERAAALEQELHAVGATHTPTPPPPIDSELRALAPHPDPELCGCQYWTDAPASGTRHDPRCEHAAKP